MALANEELDGIRQTLDEVGYHATATLPAYPARRVRPARELDLWRRYLKGESGPLETAAYPGPFHRHFERRHPELYRLYRGLFRHQTVAGATPELGGLVETTTGGWRARWQLASVRQCYILSSIPGRSQGEFVYLGDDSANLIRRVARLFPRGEGRALDFCCGCGVVGLTLAAGFSEVVGVDINPDAIELARSNAVLNRKSVSFSVSDLWQDVEGRFRLVVGNPPALPPQLAKAGHRFAVGEAKLFHDTVLGLHQHLEDGGVAVFLVFSAGDELYDWLDQNLGDFSLTYGVRESFRMSDAQVPWLHHVEVLIRRDGRGERRRLQPSWWRRLLDLALPLAPAEPLQQCGYKDL